LFSKRNITALVIVWALQHTSACSNSVWSVFRARPYRLKHLHTFDKALIGRVENQRMDGKKE